MRVKILQGHQTGHVVDVCQSEGENLLTTGFAELAPVAPAATDEREGVMPDLDTPDPPDVPTAALPSTTRARLPPALSNATRRKAR